MREKKLLKTLIGSITGLCMCLAGSITALAAPATGANIPSQTIPVTARIDTYYEIITPANINTSGGIDLTREYNSYLTSDGDTTSTFYGYTSVGMKGIIDSTKKVTATLTCADMRDNAAHTAPVGIRALTAEQSAAAAQIWAGNGNSSANKIAFGSAPWTSGTTGLTIDFTAAEVNDGTTELNKYGMLRTTLPVKGTYSSNLVIDFALANS